MGLARTCIVPYIGSHTLELEHEGSMPKKRRSAEVWKNPFIIGHLAEGEGFADREKEVARICTALRDPSSRVLVYGDRRVGKSSALRVAAEQVRAGGLPVAVVDLANATSAEAAAQRVLAAVQKEVGRRWSDLLLKAVGKLKGTVTVTPSLAPDGTLSLAFSVTPATDPSGKVKQFIEVLDAIEAELDVRGVELGLGLDEFQRLRQWCGDEIDWPLKEMFERHRRIGYVLAGSEKSLIEQMLENKKAGFWKVVEILPMGPIPERELADWLVERSKATGLGLSPDAAAAVIRIAGPRTRDVVQLARAVWDRTRSKGAAGTEDVVEAMDLLVVEQAALHQKLWMRLHDVARKVLLLVATEPKAELTGASTLSKHNLGPKTTVHRVLKDLVVGEVLVEAVDGFLFDDPFFRRWVQLNVLQDVGREAPPLLNTWKQQGLNLADVHKRPLNIEGVSVYNQSAP